MLAAAVRARADRGPRAAQGLGSGLQRFSIGVNLLLVPHMLVWVGFAGMVLVAAGLSVAFIPLALWGRRFEPARKSLELASSDELGLSRRSGLPIPAWRLGWCSALSSARARA